MRACWAIVLLLSSALAQEFRGLSELARFARNNRATLLLYFNNENNFWLFQQGRSVPLKLDVPLFRPEACCAHRATPALARDGIRLAYVHLQSMRPRREAITVINTQDGTNREVFSASTIWGISWSPAADRIAVVADQLGEKGHEVLIVDVVTASVMQTKGSDSNDSISDYAPPSWSSDGTQLAIELRRTGPGANNSSAGAIAVWNLASGTLQRIADGVEPSWSPREDQIAFFDGARKHCYSIHSNGTGQRLLFSSTRGAFGIGGGAPLFFPVVWSASGRSLIFHEWVDADLLSDVYEFDLGTGKRRHIAKSEVQVVNWTEASRVAAR